MLCITSNHAMQHEQSHNQPAYIHTPEKWCIEKALKQLRHKGFSHQQRLQIMYTDINTLLEPPLSLPRYNLTQYAYMRSCEIAKHDDPRIAIEKTSLCDGERTYHGLMVISLALSTDIVSLQHPHALILHNPTDRRRCVRCTQYVSQSPWHYEFPCGHKLCQFQTEQNEEKQNCFTICEPHIAQHNAYGTCYVCPSCGDNVKSFHHQHGNLSTTNSKECPSHVYTGKR